MGLAVGGVLYLRTIWRKMGKEREALERWILRAPLVSYLFAMSQMVSIARLLSLALSSGLSLPRALSLTAQATSSLLYRQALEEVRTKVVAGVALSVALNHHPHLFSTLFRSMVSTGERTADIPSMLRLVKGIYEEDYEHRIKALGSVIEPLLLIFVGVVVGGIMLAMLLPYFSVLGKLGGS